MREFVFYWRDGKVDRGTGKNVADALSSLGYGNGALSALDYWDYAQSAATHHDDVRKPTSIPTRA